MPLRRTTLRNLGGLALYLGMFLAGLTGAPEWQIPLFAGVLLAWNALIRAHAPASLAGLLGQLALLLVVAAIVVLGGGGLARLIGLAPAPTPQLWPLAVSVAGLVLGRLAWSSARQRELDGLIDEALRGLGHNPDDR